MPLRSGDTAPYAPPSTVLHVIQVFRDRGLTVPIALDVLLRAGVGETVAPRVLRTLQLLELITDQGQPTDAFEGLRRASSDEFRQRLEAIIRNVYAEVFQFTDPSKDDQERVTDAFRPYEPIGQRMRMVTFFLGLCEAAGIIPEGARKAVAPISPRSTSKKKPTPPQPRQTQQHGIFRNRLSSDDEGMVPEPLTGVLRAVPTNGRGWTQEKRNQFVEMFGKVLDFCVPIRAQEPEVEDDTEE